jgi:4-amino-4-deoxy-L-arabinose transferase-like glycosyltransferase
VTAPGADTPPKGDRPLHRPWLQALLLTALCLAIFLPGLGSAGLSMSEGHRAIPAWEMLRDAQDGEPHWLVPRMFGTDYLRKPPGALWAIAGASALLGETELAARLPGALGATALALAVWWFATRWFGRPWGLAAGLAQALLPVAWPSARSAEIEPLHLLTTGMACLLVIDAARARGLAPRAVLLALAVAAMALTKGPAGMPFVAGAMVGLATMRPGRGPLVWSLLGIGAGVGLAALALRPMLGAAEAPDAVSQGVGEFLWTPDRALSILTLGPVTLATMLPASLALLFPWGPDFRRELHAAPEGPSPERFARALAWAALASLAVLTLAGVSNPRYALPLCALLTPLVAWVARGGWGSGGGAMLGRRPAIARAVFLRSPLAWPAALVLASGVFVAVLEPQRRASSGREAGLALAAHLPDGAEVWADELIEARPEVLHYARREAERQGRRVRVRWIKPEFPPREAPPGLLLALREDELVDEVRAWSAEARFGPFEPVARGEVHKYRFVLIRP